ncbi:MAG TPA: outer membrane protein transport protein [Verrucomicrobiales bacterium]|nr:outer membrane protein transport protein [Verrucomicrobiales bacterium]
MKNARLHRREILTDTRCLFILALSGCVAFPQASTGSEALGVIPESAKAIAMPGGRFANLDDASVLFHSPANMLFLEEPELQVNLGLWHGDLRFAPRAGDQVELLDGWEQLGSLFYVHPIEPGKSSLGIGLSTPFGLNYDYPDHSSIRYTLPNEALLLTLDLSIAAAYKITDTLSLGAGIETVYSELTLEQFFPWAFVVPGTPDGLLEFDADGWGFGGFAGLNWEFRPNHRLAVVGRLPIKIEYDGDFTAGGLPPPLETAGLVRRTAFSSDITFPGSVSIGYGFDIRHNVTIGFDFRWIKNSSHDAIPLDIGRDQTLLGTTKLALDWEDSIDAGFGVEWRVNDHAALRAGYLFSENPFPTFTYTPAVPSNERHLFSVGLGLSNANNRLDLAYSYAYLPDRTIGRNQEPSFIGDYKFAWHVVTITYQRRF